MFLTTASSSDLRCLILFVIVSASMAEYSWVTTNVTTKPGCSSQCGNITVPYPFGIGVGSRCSMRNHVFDINCTTSGNTTKAYLYGGDLEVMHISETQVRIRNDFVSYACYNSIGFLTSNFSTWIRLGTTSPYTFSQTANKFTVIGCDDGAIFSDLHDSNDHIGGCFSFCSKEDDVKAGPCNGLGCSQTSFPQGLKSFYAKLASLGQHLKVNNFDACGYAFLGEEAQFKFDGIADLRKDRKSFTAKIAATVPVVLEWTAGNGTCIEARSNATSYACQGNYTECIDFEPGQGYRCTCLPGYEGNPYIGCTDINECADADYPPCMFSSVCINTPGNFSCFCPDGQPDDRLHNGLGCLYIDPHATKTVVGAVLGGGLVMMLMLLFCYWLYRVLKKRRQTIQKAKNFERNGGLLLEQRIAANKDTVEAARPFTSDELVKATDNFNADRILGQGGQGTVYKGMLADGKIVAIKKSKKVDESQREQFINEVFIMSQINHRNIVKLLGCCLETEVPLLVYEFIPNGALDHHIHHPSDEFHITWEMRLQIAIDAAGALAYLHSDSSLPIYHRDIKSSNILLDEKYRAKVSDFGVSRSISVDQTHLTTQVIGTFGYLDPEYFQSHKYTEKSDVYSFGVVLVELITGQKVILPAGSQRDASLVQMFLSSMNDSSILDIVDPVVLNEGRKEEFLLVADLAKRCLSMDGRQRPSMRDVATGLKAVRSQDGAHPYQETSSQTLTSWSEIMLVNNSFDGFSTTSTSGTGLIASKSIDTHPLLFDSTE